MSCRRIRPLFAMALCLLLPLSARGEDGPIVVTPKQLLEAFRDDQAAAIARWATKPLEMTAKLTYFDASYSGGSYIFLDGVKFQAVHVEPWAIALPGQTLKVRGTMSDAGELNLTIVEVQGERPVLAASDLTTEFAKNAEAICEKYGDRWIEVRGSVVKKDDDSATSIVLQGAGDSLVVCHVLPEELKDVEVGKPARIVAQFDKTSREQPALMIGRVITKAADKP